MRETATKVCNTAEEAKELVFQMRSRLIHAWREPTKPIKGDRTHRQYLDDHRIVRWYTN
jgi:hypothetical protein